MRYSPKEGKEIFNSDYVEELNYSKLVKENNQDKENLLPKVNDYIIQNQLYDSSESNKHPYEIV